MLSSFASRVATSVGEEPSFRVPGASLAARTYAEAAQPRRLDAQDDRPPQAPRSAPAPPTRAAGGGGAAGQCGAADFGRGRWSDEDVPCDHLCDDNESAYAEEDVAMDAEAEEDAVEDEDWDEPSPEDLRQNWLRECRAVRALAAQGAHASSAALAAARGARDRAEEIWRRSRKPVPLPVRMGFAQRKLEKAEAALTRIRYELEEFEAEADRRRDEIRRRMEEADARYRSRVSQLDELHAEAGGLASGAAANGTAAKRAGREDKLCAMVAQELQALAESLEEGTEARGKVNLVLSRMASASAQESHEQYHIGDDGDEGESGGVTPTWSADASGRWSRHARKGGACGKGGDTEPAAQQPGTGPRLGKAHGASIGAGVEGKGKPVGSGATSGPASATSDGGETRATSGAAPLAAAKTRGSGTRPREELGEEEGTRSKSHRGHDELGLQSVETEGDDHRRALKLREEQAIAAAAAIECNAVFGDERSRQIAGQLYEHKVNLIETRAIALGIQPTSEGRQLLELSPEELADWIRATLEPAERAAKEDKEI